MKKALLTLIILPAFTFAQFEYHQGFGVSSAYVEYFNSVIAVSNGNMICVGGFRDTLDTDPSTTTLNAISNGFYDGLVGEYEPSENVSWIKSFGNSGWDEVQNIDIDQSGDIIISGFFTDSIDLGGGWLKSVGPSDLFVAKFDPAGQHIWSKSLGGTEENETVYMDVDHLTGSIALCGSYKDSLSFGPQVFYTTDLDPWIAVLDNNGDHSWSHTFGSSDVRKDYAKHVQFDDEGNVYLAGVNNELNVDIDPGPGLRIISANMNNQAYLIKYDGAGNYINSIIIDSTGQEGILNISTYSNSGVFITGYTTSTALEVDPDPLSTVFLNADTALNKGNDILVIKYNSALDFQWGMRYGTRFLDQGQIVKCDEQGNVIIAGKFGEGTIDLDPGPGIFNITTDTLIPGNTSSLIAQYDASGNFIDAIKLEKGFEINGMYVSQGKVYISGAYTLSGIDMDAGVTTDILTNYGYRDAFMAVYRYSSIGIGETKRNVLNIFPNPSAGEFIITGLRSSDKNIFIYDLSGRLVRTIRSMPASSIDLSDLDAGIYLVSSGGSTCMLVKT